MTDLQRSGQPAPDLDGEAPRPAERIPRSAGHLMTAKRDERDNMDPVPEKTVPPAPKNTPLLDNNDKRHITRNVKRGSPGEAALASRGHADTERSRQKSHFYSEAFAYRESNLSVCDRIYKESVITAEVKTNVIINDEYNFINSLSNQLSHRYQRPVSSILITLHHSACLLYGGSFDPACVFTITALPPQVQPATNKRNAALLQKFISETLCIRRERGVIRFVSIGDENLATNGMTIQGMIEHSAKVAEEGQRFENKERKNNPKRDRGHRVHESAPKEHVVNILRDSSHPRTEGDDLSAPPSQPMPGLAADQNPSRKEKKMQSVGKKKSLMAIFGR